MCGERSRLPETEASDLTSRRLLLAILDLAGFARLGSTHPDRAIAELLHEYYGLCTAAVQDAGGSVLKYMGDAVMALFAPEAAPAAVARIVALQQEILALGQRRGMAIEGGGNLHLTDVVAGPFGPDARFDVIGSGVNHLFLMGGGPGLRISEAVHRALPSEAQSAWRRVQPPAVYHRQR